MNTSTKLGFAIVAALVAPLGGCSDDGVPFDDGANTAAGTSGEDTGGVGTAGTFTTTGGETRGSEETSGSATTATTSPTSGTTDPDEGDSDGLDDEDGTGDTGGDSESTGGETGDDAGTTTGDTDGCSDNDDCEATEYCDFPDGQCGQGSPGSCTVKPDGCGGIYMPVCGCDEQTYSNACVAAAAGVDVASEDECPP